MHKMIAIMVTLDTKGAEVKYIKDVIEERGKDVLIIDTGLRGAPLGVGADITRKQLAEARIGMYIQTYRRIRSRYFQLENCQ